MKPEQYSILRECEDQHWWYVVLRGLVLAEMQGRVPVGTPVLDAGCGTGGMMERLKAWQMEGIDSSELAVRLCEERGLIHVRQGSVNELPYADGSFAAVLCLNVLYHEDVEPPRALAEMMRVLRPGGVFISNHAAFDVLRGGHDASVCGARRYTARRMRTALAAHAVRIETMHYWNAWLFLPLLLRRLLGSRSDSDLKMPPRWLNALLAAAGRIDARLCRLLALPFGSSLFVVATKDPGQGGAA